MANKATSDIEEEYKKWLSGNVSEKKAISGNPTAWRVEPQGKNRKYWQLRRRITKDDKRKRESKYIGSWEQAKEIYPAECSNYRPRK